MNKLGFAIKLASQGAGNAIECNKDQWTNKVVDIREYLKFFNGLQGTDNIVTFMSFDEGGCFLTQLRAISGRIGDFLSGWIYIPNTIEITSTEVMNAFNYVRGILSESNLNDLRESINEFFSKEYPLNNYSAQYTPSHGDKFGVRFIGHYSLQEILDDRYQSYYSDCKAIFLLEKTGEVSITKEAGQSMFKNYTEREITKTAVLIPPTQQELQVVGIGTRILITTGEEFRKPMVVSLDSQKKFILYREGFENIAFTTSVKSERQKLVIPSNSIEWMKRVSASMFRIMNNKGEDIKNIGLRILINGNDITNKDILVPENECANAIVEIHSAEYELYQSPMNILKNSYSVTLTRKNKCFQSRIELAKGKYGDITVESEYIASKDASPLKGYTLGDDRGGEKYLRVSEGFIWKQRGYGFLIALIIGTAFIGYVSVDSFFDTHHLKFGWPPYAKDVIEGNTSLKDSVSEGTGIDNKSALNYINEHEKLEKNKLENYELTIGLYDMINEYRFNDIVKLGSEYNDCEVISNVKNLSQQMIQANKTMTDSYSSDGTITIQKWIEKVNSKLQEEENPDPNAESDINSPKNKVQEKKTKPKEKQNNTKDTSGKSDESTSGKNKDTTQKIL